MKVLGFNVLVEQDPPKTQIGSLFVPDGEEEYPNTGTIRAVGSLVTCVAVGNRVAFKRKPATAISPEARKGEEFYGLLVLPDDHLLAVIDDE